MYYDFYGDASLIVNYYNAMKAYVQYLSTKASGHILSHGLGDWYDYGNFKAGFSRNTPVPLVATAYYYYDITLLAQAARMIGNKSDEIHYNRLAEEVRRAFNHRFFNPETGIYGTGSQASQAIPLYLNMVDEAHRGKVLQQLLNDIEKRGTRLSTGDVGNRYLFQTLAKNGQNEVMYKMHNHEEAPGYGFQLKFGATTLTEQWDPRMGSSWNHFMMGQIDEWFFASLAGIRPGKPGFKEIIIRPEAVGDLSYVKASHRTAYGKIAVNWEKSNEKFLLNVEIPVNCSAKIYLPGESNPVTVLSGRHQFEKQLKQ
jgi:alpha-L-rhamnosidase